MSTPPKATWLNWKRRYRWPNLQFPIQASEDVLIKKIELSDEAVIYICRVDEDLCDMNQIKANAAEVKQGIIETLGNQTDLATQLFYQKVV